MPLLSESQIEEQLSHLPDWFRNGEAIQKQYTFTSFLEAIDFINTIAPLAETADHHPEIHNVYNRVTITLATHDAGGITEKDTALAEKIERCVRV